VFDKVRHDPDAPNAYGASITFDLPVGRQDAADYAAISETLETVPAAAAG
jgi:NitT/TauT family transport system ATP-binding protein